MRTILITIVISILPLINLLTPGLPVTHDGQDHVARIANFYQSLSEGVIVPRWAGNLNWGYGHPILMFLYPLPSYIASLLHFIGFTFVDSTKLVFALGFIASMFAMYFWIKEVWGNQAGFIAALLYGFAPYRFVDLYVRGALGEHIAFVFAPLACLYVLKISKTGFRWVPYLSVSVAGLILSHNALSLMFLPLIILYGLYLALFELQTKDRKIFVSYTATAIFLGFMLSAFFWIPAFFEGKYTLRDIVTRDGVTERFVPLLAFFRNSWNYGQGNEFSKSVGIIQLIAVLSGIFILIKEKQKNIQWFIGGLYTVFIICLFIMSSASWFVWDWLPILEKFQFPWRFMSMVVFVTSVIAAWVLKNSKSWMTAVVVLLVFLTTFPMWKAKSYRIIPESFFTGVYAGTTDTGESSPIWSVRFMEQYPKESLEIIEGEVNIQLKRRTSVSHEYTVNALTSARLAENTLYFPGWTVNVDGKPVAVEFQDPAYRGLMTYWLEPGVHQVDVNFSDTKVRKLSTIISLITFISVILSIIYLSIQKCHRETVPTAWRSH